MLQELNTTTDPYLQCQLQLLFSKLFSCKCTSASLWTPSLTIRTWRRPLRLFITFGFSMFSLVQSDACSRVSLELSQDKILLCSITSSSKVRSCQVPCLCSAIICFWRTKCSELGLLPPFVSSFSSLPISTSFSTQTGTKFQLVLSRDCKKWLEMTSKMKNTISKETRTMISRWPSNSSEVEIELKKHKLFNKFVNSLII